MAISKIENNSLASGVPSTANLPAGTVLQVVQGTLTTAFSTTSTSLVSTGLTATITPTSSSSKILVRVTCFAYNGTNGYNANLGLSRGATYLNPTTGYSYWGASQNSNTGRTGTYSTESLDSPATTSATTYVVSLSAESGSTAYFNTQYVGATPATNPAVATITLMEIAA